MDDDVNTQQREINRALFDDAVRDLTQPSVSSKWPTEDELIVPVDAQLLFKSHKATVPSLEAVRSLGVACGQAVCGTRLTSQTQLLCSWPLNRGLRSSSSCFSFSSN